MAFFSFAISALLRREALRGRLFDASFLAFADLAVIIFFVFLLDVDSFPAVFFVTFLAIDPVALRGNPTDRLTALRSCGRSLARRKRTGSPGAPANRRARQR